jgi:hypothetical protein
MRLSAVSMMCRIWAIISLATLTTLVGHLRGGEKFSVMTIREKLASNERRENQDRWGRF